MIHIPITNNFSFIALSSSLPRQVKIWFQNRRMKWRNSKERELLANGGSRDQTLPNKNNPNPDLSDARNDRQPSMSPPSSPSSHPPMPGQIPSIGMTGGSNGSLSPHADGSYSMHNADKSNIGGGSDVQMVNATGGLMTPAKDLFKYEFGGGNAGANGSGSVEDNRAAAGQHMFNHFYDKLRDVNGIMAAAANGGFGAAATGGGAGGGSVGTRPTSAAVQMAAAAAASAAASAAAERNAASPAHGGVEVNAAMNVYYDDYDSNSDSDEEISVT